MKRCKLKSRSFSTELRRSYIEKKIISADFEQEKFARKSAKRFQKWANCFAQNRPKLFFYYVMCLWGTNFEAYEANSYLQKKNKAS